MIKWECYDLRETKEFLGIYINCNYKNQKIFIDQFEYLNKVCHDIVKCGTDLRTDKIRYRK